MLDLKAITIPLISFGVWVLAITSHHPPNTPPPNGLERSDTPTTTTHNVKEILR